MNIQQKLLQKANQGAGLKRSKTGGKKSGKKDTAKKEKSKASSVEVGVSPFPIPWKCTAERKRQKVEAACKDCGVELAMSDFDEPKLYFQCITCSVAANDVSLFCNNCQEDHPQRHPSKTIILCSLCGSIHPPIETMCESLWCQSCGVQSHVGTCNAKMTSCDICGSYCDHSTPHCPSIRCPTLPTAIKTAVSNSTAKEPVTRYISKLSSDSFLDFVTNGTQIEIPKQDENNIQTAIQQPAMKDELLKPDWLICGTCNQPGHLMCNGRGDLYDRKSPWNITKIQCTKCQQSTHVTSQCGIRGNRLFGITQQSMSL